MLKMSHCITIISCLPRNRMFENRPEWNGLRPRQTTCRTVQDTTMILIQCHPLNLTRLWSWQLCRPCEMLATDFHSKGYCFCPTACTNSFGRLIGLHEPVNFTVKLSTLRGPRYNSGYNKALVLFTAVGRTAGHSADLTWCLRSLSTECTDEIGQKQKSHDRECSPLTTD